MHKSCKYGKNGARYIIESLILNKLISLKLTGSNRNWDLLIPPISILANARQPIDDSIAKGIANQEKFKCLKYLDLSFNELSDEGLLALAQSENLPGLEELSVHFNKFSDEGIHKAFTIKPPHLKNLKLLTIDDADDDKNLSIYSGVYEAFDGKIAISYR